MKSGTSFFNGTGFRKNITRFLPLWSIYLIGCIVVLLGIISEYQPSTAINDLEMTICLMAVVNMIYALISAELLFGDLFNSRLCNALHAMPLRREGWFLTNAASGLCFGFVPHLVLALCFIPRLEWHWTSAFVWMLAVDLEYLFFFALAVFCVFCTGSRFATALVYGLMNFLSLLAGWLIDTVYVPLLNGVVFNWDPFHKICPVVQLVMNEDYFFYYDKSYSSWISEGWVYLIVLTVVAVALLIGSLLLYRKRKLEYAGDFLAVKRLEPVFHIIYALTVGTVFHLFSDLFLDDDLWILFLMVGLVIGFFTGQMLLQRTVRVFSGKTFLGFGILVAVLLGSLGLTKLDPLGISTWVPEAEQVRRIELCHDIYAYYYNVPATLTDEEIPAGLEIHRQLLEAHTEENPDSRITDIEVVYTLSSDRQVHRKYQIPVNSVVGQTLNRYFSAPENILEYTDWEKCLDGLLEIQVEQYCYTGEDARALLAAVKADCEAGTMTQDWDFHDPEDMGIANNYTWISITFDNSSGTRRNFRELIIFDDCLNTVAWLQEREDEWRYEYSDYKY